MPESVAAGARTDALEPAGLELRRLGPERPAGLWQASMPWPARATRPLSLAESPTYIKPLGQWPDARPYPPRRLFLAADAGGTAPEVVRVRESAPVDAVPPSSEMHCFARSPDRAFLWERPSRAPEAAMVSSQLDQPLAAAGPLAHRSDAHHGERRFPERRCLPGFRAVPPPAVATEGEPAVTVDRGFHDPIGHVAGGSQQAEGLRGNRRGAGTVPFGSQEALDAIA